MNIAYKVFTCAQLPPPNLCLGGPPIYCTDCLTPNGTGGYVQSDGTKWRLFNGLEATTDPLTYGRSHWQLPVSKIETAVERYVGGLMENRSGDQSLVYSTATNVGDSSLVGSEGYGASYQTSTSASGYGLITNCVGGTAAKTTAQQPVIYGSIELLVNQLSSLAEEYFLIAGIGLRTLSNAVDANFAGFLYDRGNAWSANAGNLATWLSLGRKASTNGTVTDSTVAPLTSTTLQRLEWLYSGGTLKTYIGGVTTTPISTIVAGDLPTVSVYPFVVRIGKTNGTTSRHFDVSRICSVVRYV